MTSRRPNLRRVILWDVDYRDSECVGQRLALFGFHRDRVFDIKEFAAQRRTIEIEAAPIEEFVHRPARMLVGVTKLLDQGAHSIWVHYAHFHVKTRAHCARDALDILGW